MGLLGDLLNKKEKETISTNQDFWNWFTANEKAFFKVIKSGNNVEQNFFDVMSSQLNQLRKGYWYLAGMLNDTTAELILTADGAAKNIAFVEDLVTDAPQLDGWKFTALKPEKDIDKIRIEMGELKFGKENLWFCSNENPACPDEIDISIVHPDYTEELKEPLTTGAFIFLDNYLGELTSTTVIDYMEVIGKEQANSELIPIEKLKDFLIWRQKEFVEKYEGLRYNTDDDTYQSLEGTLKNGNPLVAIVNSTLLKWDRKASHPWIMTIEIDYKGNESGMPNTETYNLMNEFEDGLIEELKDADGYLNIGRQTADNKREIYFACKDFRKSSKVVSRLQDSYEDRLDVSYDIYKDKYWQSFDRFMPNPE